MKAMKVSEFAEWLKTAKRGYTTQYYLGFLGAERQTDVYIGKRVFVTSVGTVDEIGNAAMAAYEQNLVHLVQRKVTDGVYEYLAIRR